MTTFDTLLAGAGPAGLALAAELAERGMRVGVVDPAPRAAWPNRYGEWAGAAAEAGLDGTTAARWATTEVRIDSTRQHLVDEGYIRVDGAALQARLLARCEQHGVQLIQGRAMAATHRAHHSRLQLEDGELCSRLILDATGPRRQLTECSGPPADAFQTALGWEIEVRSHPYPLDRMLLMDFCGEDPLPTFLYAMPLSPTRLFVEETALVARPAIPFDSLQRRLEQRLASAGIRVVNTHDVERCRIPMNPPLPSLRQRVLAVGAAAGVVHPATGYVLSRSLRSAPLLADALVQHMEQGPASAVRAAWLVQWPAPARRARALHQLGADTLLSMSRPQIASFFDAFFQLPDHHRRAYLRSDASGGQVAAAMLAVFFLLGLPGRLTTLRAGLSRSGAEAVRNLVDTPRHV